MSFPKKGKVFPADLGRPKGPSACYSVIVSTALRASLGETHQAVKTLMRWTGANGRTAKNWLLGTNGPDGNHLLVLLRESDAVLEAIIAAVGRRNVLDAIKLLEAHDRLTEMLAVGRLLASAGPHGITEREDSGQRGQAGDLQDEPINDLRTEPINEPESPVFDALGNHRQCWFLQELARGRRVKGADLRAHWGISASTAKRDISALKARGLIAFVGPPKTGGYRLINGTDP